MIELSKCPNCASEDKVTIAGKDFCMRCGTPSTEPQQNSTVSVDQTAGNDLPDRLDPITATAEVTKFNSATTQDPQTRQIPDQQAVEQSTTASQPDVNQQPIAIPNDVAAQTPQTPIMPPPQQLSVTTASPQQVESPQPLQQATSNSPASQPTAPVDQSPQVQIHQPPVEQATSMPTTQPIPQNGTVQTTQAESQPIQTPMAVPVDIQTQDHSPQQPIGTPTPEPMHIPTDQPLTQPGQNNNSQASEALDVKPAIHTHQAIMSLDKNDNGVFSDEQLDELGKNIADKSEPLNPAAQHQATIVPDAGVSKPTSIHTDIRPPSSNTNSDIDSRSAVSKVAENSVKVPDKNSKTKKALKPAGIALSIVALFLVGAYIWQVNYPTLAFKIASAKAGMSAAMPGYIPGGYKLSGEIQTNPGSVSYSLINGGQDKKISITQTKTDWDSQALAENYVAPKAENYLALQAQGLTLYMLGDSQATWVNKGTWYKIESPDQSLSQDQAIKIATSL